MTIRKNPHINAITYLKYKPNSQYAFHLLEDINNSVALLMNENGLKVSVLAEFYPKQKNLLGLNLNHGYKIMLRLRQPYDDSQFLSRDEIIDTMIHELTHNKIGPHNAAFKKLMNELCGRQYIIETLGLTYNFLGVGKRLGGKNIGGKYNIRQQRIHSLQNGLINMNKNGNNAILTFTSTSIPNNNSSDCLQKLRTLNEIRKQRLTPKEMAAKAAIERLQKQSGERSLPFKYIEKNNADDNVNIQEILSQHDLMESQVEEIIIIDSDISTDDDDEGEEHNTFLHNSSSTPAKEKPIIDFIDLT